ncbi:hypothetical protein ACWGE1_38145 [Streptomyces sp. NPDC054932]
MKSVVRGAAVAAALVLALTGCEEGKKPATAGEQGMPTSVPGATAQGAIPRTPTAQAARLDAAALMKALPDESDVSKWFSGGEPFAGQGAEAVKACAKETGVACTGLVAFGGKDTQAGSGSTERRVEFRLFSFETAEQARAAMKGLADKQRKSAAEYNEPSQPLTLVSGADENDGFMDDATADAVMRIDTVLAYVSTTENKPKFLDHVAGLQVDRVRSVAAGRNPGL